MHSRGNHAKSQSDVSPCACGTLGWLHLPPAPMASKQRAKLRDAPRTPSNLGSKPWHQGRGQGTACDCYLVHSRYRHTCRRAGALRSKACQGISALTAGLQATPSSRKRYRFWCRTKTSACSTPTCVRKCVHLWCCSPMSKQRWGVQQTTRRRVPHIKKCQVQEGGGSPCSTRRRRRRR